MLEKLVFFFFDGVFIFYCFYGADEFFVFKSG